MDKTTRKEKAEANMLLEKLQKVDKKLAMRGLRQESETYLRAKWQSFADDKKIVKMALTGSMLDERRIKDSMEAHQQQNVAE